MTTAVIVPILSSIKLSKGRALTSLLLILLHGGLRYPRDGLTIEGAHCGRMTGNPSIIGKVRVADRSSQNGPFLCNVLLSGDWDRPAPEKARSKISRHGRMALLQENRRGSYVLRAACLTIPGSCQRRSVPSHIRSHGHFDLFFLAPLRFFSTKPPRNQAQSFASPERDKTQVRARECGVRSLQAHSRRGPRR